MTLQEFNKKVNRTNAFEKYWNYFICISFFVGGPFLIYQCKESEGWVDVSESMWISLYSMVTFFMGLSVYGFFWKIPQTYKLTEIKTDVDFEFNVRVLNHVQYNLDLQLLDEDYNYFKFEFKGKFFNRFPVYVFIAQDKIYINVQSKDFGNDGGFIDFGASGRVTRKVKKEIEACCQHQKITTAGVLE